MSQQAQPQSFRERVAQVRERVAEWLVTFRPGARTYLTAWCVGATIGQYAALAGSTDPKAILAAITALSAQLGVNLLADIIGDRKPPPGLTVEEIAQAVQERLEQGDDLPAVRVLLEEFDTLQLALETWRRADHERWQQLVDELSRHPQLIADQVTEDVVTSLDPKLASLDKRTQQILDLLEATPAAPGSPPSGALKVFISGTQIDMQPEREAVETAIAGLRLIPLRAETLGSQPQPSREAILKAVAECDIYLGIYGDRYGWRVPKLGISATELEYDEAQRLGKPTLVYVKEVESPEPAQEAFLIRVQDFDAGYFRRPRFYSTEELADWVQQDVASLVSELVRDPAQVRHRQLALAYAGEVRQKFEYWRRRYVALPARGALSMHESERAATGTAEDRTPRYFHPRGFRVNYRGTPQDQPSERRKEELFDDARAAVSKAGDAVLLGEPGAGKTTTLWRLMLDYSDKAIDNPGSPSPVLVPLGGYDGQSNVLELVRRQLAEAVIEDEHGNPSPLPAHRRLAKQLEEALTGGRLLFLFDGLNEMPRDHYADAVARLASFRTSHPRNSYLFTCREADYNAPLPISEIHIEPLTDEGLRDFVHAYLPQRADALIGHLWHEARQLWEMGQNPYFLRMIVAIYGEHGVLPANRAELFGEFVGTLLRRERLMHHDRFLVSQNQASLHAQADLLQTLTAHWAPLGEWESLSEAYGFQERSKAEHFTRVIQAGLMVIALARLAYAMAAGEEWGTTVSKEFVAWQLSKPLCLGERQVLIDVERLLYLAHSASLVEITPDGIRFTHQLLQEYFAAVHLNTLGPGSLEASECLRQDVWDETMVLLAGFTGWLDQLVERSIPLDPLLAARCAGVTPERLSQSAGEQLAEALAMMAEGVFSPWREQALAQLGAAQLRSAVPVLLDLAQHGSYSIRSKAVAALGEIGGQESVPLLMGILRHKEPYIREAAAQALASLGAHEAVPLLAEIIEKENIKAETAPTGAIVRALDKLRDQEATEPETTHLLMRKLRDDDPTVRDRAARKLTERRVRDVLPIMRQWLADDDPEARKTAFWTITEFKSDEDAPVIVDRLQDEEYGVRLAALRALSKLKQDVVKPALVNLLRYVRFEDGVGFPRLYQGLKLDEAEPDYAMLMLTVLYREAVDLVAELEVREAIPLLLEHLDDEHCLVPNAVAHILGKFRVREAVPGILWWLCNIEQHPLQVITVTHVFLEALDRLWTEADVPELLERLAHDDGIMRQIAARALGTLGAQEAIPALLTRINDWAGPVRAHAVRALGQLGATEAIPQLIRCLSDEDHDVREAAVRALDALNAQRATPQLMQRLQDKDRDVRNAAAELLCRWGVRQVFLALLPWLRDEDFITRKTAAEYLGVLGIPETWPALVEGLLDDQHYVREAAAASLSKLGTKEAMPALVLLASEGRSSSRQVHYGMSKPWEDAATALAALPPEEVLPYLFPLLAHPDGWIRMTVLPLYEQVRKKAGLPRKGEVWCALGICSAEMEQGPDARTLPTARSALWTVVHAAERASAFMPDWTLAVVRKVGALRRLGCWSRALAAIGDDMSLLRLSTEPARCLLKLGRHEEARLVLENLAAEAFEDPSQLTDTANLWLELGAIIQAEEMLDQHVFHDYMNNHRRSRALFYIQQGRYIEAKEYITRAYWLELGHSDDSGRQGQLALVQAQFECAIMFLEEARRRDPFNVEWQYALAFALVGQGEWEQAQPILEHALVHTHLHEEVDVALLNLDFLKRAKPDIDTLAIVRKAILERKMDLDRLAEEECAKQN